VIDRAKPLRPCMHGGRWEERTEQYRHRALCIPSPRSLVRSRQKRSVPARPLLPPVASPQQQAEKASPAVQDVTARGRPGTAA
jgi:hypothetical protein